jgi:hypothetical protein
MNRASLAGSELHPSTEPRLARTVRADDDYSCASVYTRATVMERRRELQRALRLHSSTMKVRILTTQPDACRGLTPKLSCGRSDNCTRSALPQPPVGCSDS